MAKINTLPAEVLLNIFMSNIPTQEIESALSVESAADPTYKPKPVIDSSKDIRNLSHVCAYWRQVVLDSKIIWSKCILDCHALPDMWFKEVRRRAGEVIPLTLVSIPDNLQFNSDYVMGTMQRSRMNSNLEFASYCSNPLTELHLYLDSDVDSGVIRRLMSAMTRPQPQMTTMSLCFERYDDNHDTDTDSSVMEVDDEDSHLYSNDENIYHNNSEDNELLVVTFNNSLRHTTPSNPLFPSLKSVRLSCLPSGLSVLSFLSNTPNLQSLALLMDTPEEVTPTHTDTISLSDRLPSNPDVQVLLPHLTQIYIKGCVYPITQLLASVDIGESQLSLLGCDIDHCVDAQWLFTLNNTLNKFLVGAPLDIDINSNPTPAYRKMYVTLPVNPVESSYRIEITTPRQKQKFYITISEHRGNTTNILESVFLLLCSPCTHIVFKCPSRDESYIQEFSDIYSPDNLLTGLRAHDPHSPLREISIPCGVRSASAMLFNIHQWLNENCLMKGSLGIKVIHLFLDCNRHSMGACKQLEALFTQARLIKAIYGVDIVMHYADGYMVEQSEFGGN